MPSDNATMLPLQNTGNPMKLDEVKLWSQKAARAMVMVFACANAAVR